MSERILLVEDNKSLSKLISMKIASDLPFEVDVAYSMKEAILFSRKFDYFLALLDLNLPDAPNGEVVDTIIKHGIPSIILSGNINKELRKSMLEKDVIDYVGKGGMDDINFIISTIKRLNKNRQHKVLLADASMTFRKKMQSMLKNLFFEVYAVAHGEEALGILNEHPDIKIVLTDYKMPVIDGLELTKSIRKNHPKEQLSILAMSSADDEEISALFLKNGATDYIKKPFSKEEFTCRITNAIEALENIETITRSMNRNLVTGLYNREHMMRSQADYVIKAREDHEHFAIGMITVDNVDALAGQYDAESIDRAIIHVSEILRINTTEHDYVAHVSDSEFCIILKEQSNEYALDTFEQLRHRVSVFPLKLDDDSSLSMTISIGVALDPEGDLEECINSADLMLYQAKNGGGNQIASTH